MRLANLLVLSLLLTNLTKTKYERYFSSFVGEFLFLCGSTELSLSKSTHNKKSMKELRAEIEIQASAERVWALLTDFAGFPAWNPFIRRVKGDPRVGEQIEVMLQPSGMAGMVFRPTILSIKPDRELRWLGHLLVPGLFDGEHIFTIEPLGANRVRFIQYERFTGMLVPIFSKRLDTDTQRGFEEMNQALKKLAEQAD